MAQKSVKYVSEVAKDLLDPEYAWGYLQAGIEDHGLSYKESLAEMIDAFGHTEFSIKINMAPSNVTRLVKRLKEGEDIKESTLDLVAEGFGLKVERRFVI